MGRITVAKLSPTEHDIQKEEKQKQVKSFAFNLFKP